VVNGGTALAPRPARLARADRLVVLTEDADLPPWVAEWCHRAGWELCARRLPATVPGRRPTPVPLFAQIAALATDPVLVLGPDGTATAPPEVTAALHALPDDTPVLAAAVDTARHLGGRVVLTHGLPLSFAERSVGLRTALDHAHQLLDEAAGQAAACSPDVRVTTRLVRAHPHELVGEDLDTALLVIGGPRRDVGDDLGLVVRSALHHATCPVLVVPR
jgi:nucleotide-binding universal stress UspA family protein